MPLAAHRRSFRKGFCTVCRPCRRHIRQSFLKIPHAGSTQISLTAIIAVAGSEFEKSRQIRGAQGSPQDQQCVIHAACGTGAFSFGSFSLSAPQQTIDRASKEKEQYQKDDGFRCALAILRPTASLPLFTEVPPTMTTVTALFLFRWQKQRNSQKSPHKNIPPLVQKVFCVFTPALRAGIDSS